MRTIQNRYGIVLYSEIRADVLTQNFCMRYNKNRKIVTVAKLPYLMGKKYSERIVIVNGEYE